MESGRATYTHDHHESLLRLLRWRTLDNSAAYLKPRLSAGARVLDVGCGPGTITADLAARVAPGRVAALDVSRHALAEAEATVAGRGLSNVDFVLGDVHELDFPDGVFDVVHAHQVLQHVADPVRALAQMRRVCRTGGTVAARDIDCAAMTWYPLRPELSEWLAAYEKVARANGGEPDAGRRLLSWAHAAGFTDVVCSASTWCYATAEEREWWGGLWADRLLASDAAEQAVEGGHVTMAELERFAAGWRAWSAARDGWFGVLHGEILCRA
jgi:ubiquinone/menaquinone biosynthesis C-methylase UbiE